MPFDALPPLPPLLHPGAAEYAERTLARSREAAQRHGALLDQAYGRDPRQRLDLYLPAAAPARGLPVLLYFHGGAWMNGRKEWMGFLAPALLDLPLLLVAATYRIAPQVRLPAIVQDCVDGLAWTLDNAARFGGDPGRVLVGGHSAGGHLAALLALRPELLAARGLPAGAVRACLPTSAPLDLSHLQAPQTPADAQVRAALGDEPAPWSPLRFADAAAVPFHLAWGEHDFPRIRAQNEAFAAALRARGCPVSHEVLPGLDHFTAHEATAAPGSCWVQAVRRLIDPQRPQAMPA